ncbi:phage tail assembly protein [Massilia atriviolacea]|uniref:Phage tail assembly protein n=1 Tax=Massilia atriviolacea TaxID=2495579 RepID=A0A430HF47_9BURK|nr:phage tail assembly protein [Massilia atriviolacea]RSZ56158.1 phage tail assembly protein [Massilia atriviolacea]
MAKTSNVKMSADGSAADITLTKPLNIDGTNVGALRMREPTVDDQLVHDLTNGSDAAREVEFMAKLCGLAPSNLRAMGLRDYRRVQEAFQLFID